MEWLLIPALAISAAILWSYAKMKGRNECLTNELSLVRVKAYADSFVGRNLEEARSTIRLNGGSKSVEEGDWSEDEIEGVQLTVVYASHVLTLFTVDGRVVTASVQILSG